MTIPALRLSGHADDDPVAVTLDTTSPQALARTLGSDGPQVLVIRESDARFLRNHETLVVDRGRKHRAKPLGEIMLGQSRVPLILSSYANPGRLLQGIKHLLKRADAAKENNCYVLAVAASKFDALSATTNHPESEPSSNGDPTDADSLLGRLRTEEIPGEFRSTRFIGETPEMELVRQLAVRAARGDFSVLIVGPTGSGKEAVARAIHEYGPRTGKPFRAINCGAIPAELFESEVFGYKRGAFTGANRDMPGLWQSASDGTLFLDEVADLPLNLQVKILRALQESSIRQLGSTTDIPVRARIVAATHRDLFAMVQRGTFREDLYYRLRSFLIPVPGLDEHPADIPVLAQALWRGIVSDKAGVLSPRLVANLATRRWPGNVRELKSALISLYSLFSDPAPSLEQLQTMFALQGHATGDGDSEQDAVLRHKAACLGNLRRADELLRAISVSLRPLRSTRSDSGPAQLDAVQETLPRILDELAQVTARPLLLSNEFVFSIVHDLLDKLQTLAERLESTPTKAGAYYRRVIVPELDLATKAVFEEARDMVAVAVGNGLA